MSIWKKVDSSCLSEVAYDRNTWDLYVKFPRGAVYLYKEVPNSVYDSMMGAESVGRFFTQKVKNNFEYEKLSEE